MHKILKGMTFIFTSFFFSFSHAGGGITHMFLAEETISYISDPTLRNLLLDNLDAYRVGAYYPDSGYTKKSHYGEDSHGDLFIYTFADYIKEKYPIPELQNPKLVAFLFGCASHRVSDEIIHWTFYPEIAREDFNGDYDKAHTYGDIGIDLELVIDKNQWRTHPKNWWVPVDDLVNIYQRMGKSYSRDEIIWGNRVIYTANYAERLIAAPAYLGLQWKMPWTSHHYYDWPKGGMQMDEEAIAKYQMALWEQLHHPVKKHIAKNPMPSHSSPLIEMAENAIENHTIHISIQNNDDASIEIQSPVGLNESLLNEWIRHL
jgi:hypothetical protein